jgi:hypothetical protein
VQNNGTHAIIRERRIGVVYSEKRTRKGKRKRKRKKRGRSEGSNSELN